MSLLLAFVSRLATWTVAYTTHFTVPLFDASPALIQVPEWSKPFLRWDSFHFLHIAENGHVFEHEWAFFPGLPFVMRHVAALLGSHDYLFAGALAALVSCDSTRVLYELSVLQLGSPPLASLATFLSLLPSSPATLHMTGYTEPFFTYFSYRGMLDCAKSRWLRATVSFTLASAFRSNGILLVGFLVWGMVLDPFFSRNRKIPSLSRLLYTFMLSSMMISPFIYHQVTGYRAFCSGREDSSAWCARWPPLIYSHVQSKYWGGGFLKYWTLAQSPNIALGLPPLVLIASFAFHHIKHVSSENQGPFGETDLTPHVLHGLALSGILLFGSHTQIALRVAASMPLIYWAAAWLLTTRPRLGAIWVGWSILWGVLSVMLWGAFLPPA